MVGSVRICGIAIAVMSFLAIPVFPQNVVINEFMSSNNAAITDEDGDFSDWIELYNAGTEAVDLAGWGISDKSDEPFVWVFPQVVVQPGQYLLVWASGKDRKPQAFTPLQPDTVSGLVRWFSADTLALNNGNPVSIWNDGSGLGNNAVQTNTANQPSFVTSAIGSKPAVVFTRTQSDCLTFPVTSFNGLSNYLNLTMMMLVKWNGAVTSGLLGDYPRSLNSEDTHYEIQSGGKLRLRIGLCDVSSATGVVTSGQWQLLTASQESKTDSFLTRLFVNNTQVATKQTGPGTVDIANYQTHVLGSSDSGRSFDGSMAEVIMYNRPLNDTERQGITAYLRDKYNLPNLIDTQAIPLHTNFSIDRDGESIYLTRPDGTLADQTANVSIPMDVSYGRMTDGASAWGYFKTSTPRTSNNLSVGYGQLLSKPDFSLPGGFYPAQFDLTLSHDDPNATIYYTLDGSEPTMASAVYTGPLLMRVRHTDQNLIANIETTPAFDPAAVDTDFVAQQLLPAITWMPPGLVKKATVVRARAIKNGAMDSDTATKTYWVDPQIQTRFTLPVISLSTNASNFFDPVYGIYVRGSSFVNSNPGRPWHSSPANYKNEGEDWERTVHVSFYGQDGQLWFQQNAGARIHGSATNALAQKTLRLYARDDYGDGAFSHPIFEDQPQKSYKRLLLRNSGNDWNLTLFRDALSQGVSSHMLADTQAYRPAVLYINGEYWGIHNIRERLDRYYLADTYELDDDNLDIRDGSSMSEGDSTHYNSLSSYISANDMANDTYFAEVERRMDTDQFMDYFIAQIFARNDDWPGNNIACWRLRVPYSPDMPYGHDGRWRWMLFDVEHGFGYKNLPDYDDNMLPTARNHAFFNKLLNNMGFRNRFINRFADQLNTAYLPQRILGMIEQMKANIAPEMPYHIERWQRPTSLANWDAKIQTMRDFANNRANYVRDHLRSHFTLGADQTLTLNVSGLTHGYVRINRTDINPGTPGVNAATPYPWSGKYYQGVPITLTAVPYSGYWFSHWQSAGGGTYSTQPVISVSLTGALSLTAQFVPAPQSYLMHYWSFNNPAALTTPLYTLGGASMSIEPGATTAIQSDTDEDFAGQNCRIEEAIGTHLRVNNPLGASIVISLPTTGYEANVLRYETRRSGSGAGQQLISCSTDGTTFTSLRTINIFDDDPVLQVFDVAGMAGVDNNPNFKIRIQFAQGAGGTAGNDRFDNLTLEGVPLASTNTPPQVMGVIGLREVVENSPVQIALSNYFADDDTLHYTVTIDKPMTAGVSITTDTLTISPLYRGEAKIQVIASDGTNPSAKTSFRVLVYPAAHQLRLGKVQLNYWSANEPENIFPNHFLFLQSNVPDPGLEQGLEYAYFIPHDDYHPDDLANVGYPYRLTGRSRINGLWDDGIAFINTGRDRDLGGALTAIDTTGIESADVSWLGGTLLANERQYAIRLQYRLGHTGPFSDLLAQGLPVEYVVQSDGHTQNFGPVSLPAELLNQPYVQLLWRYYCVAGTTGTRSQLRLDDISVWGWLDLFEQISLFGQWWLVTDCTGPEYCGRADLTRDGRVDLDDFAIIAGRWMESGN